MSAQTAIFKTGGKQYRVEVGSVLRVEKLLAEVGSSIDFNEVLFLGAADSAKVGQPLVANAKVSGVVQSHGRGQKVYGMKFRRRKNYRLKWGHRQSYTEIKITGIAG